MTPQDDILNALMEQIPMNLRPEVMTVVDKQKAALDKVQPTGEAGAGMVKVTVSSTSKLTKIKIEPKVLTGADDDAQFIEDLIMAAYTDACETASAEFLRIQANTMNEMSQILVEYRIKEQKKTEFNS